MSNVDTSTSTRSRSEVETRSWRDRVFDTIMTDREVYEVFHYPPELFNLLVDVIPLLNRSKIDVLLFFRGAGVPGSLVKDLHDRLSQDRQSVRKYEITRTVLERLNSRGDAAIRERREIVRRVVQFENFEICWPDDQLKARGLVASVRDVVNRRDSFTRMNREREYERRLRRSVIEKEDEKKRNRIMKIAAAKKRLYDLFHSSDTPQSRGTQLEDAINHLFAAYDILIQESFRIVRPDASVEQIDGAIEFDGNTYLVEMKWHHKKVGKPLISQHLVRIMNRADARGMFISASGYTSDAIAVCREFLQHRTIVLVHLEEVVFLLDRQGELSEFLRSKVRAAQVQKEPYLRWDGR